MRTLDEHRAATLALGTPLPAIEVPLDDADGMVLADDLRTDELLPRWDNSAMDGYAVRQADVLDLPVTLQVVADLPAGSADEPVVVAGTAARIMTGAPVPAGADTIVPVELTDAGTVTVLVRDAPPAGVHVRRAGEDAVPGDVVVVAGTLLGPAAIAAAASLGRPSVRVHRRPRVAVVSTGDELVAPGRPLRRGQIPDSNSWLLASAVREAGGVPVRIGPVPDDVDALRELLLGLDVDAVVTSGGVSVGAYDVVKAALAREPGVEFVAVAVQPGKPQGLGRLPGGTPVFTLPGNPVSSFASFEMFVRPALLRMRGLSQVERPTVDAVADDGWTTPPGRAQLMPVRWVAPGRVVRATAGGSGSHLVARLALAEGLAVIPAEIDRVAAGDRVTVLKVSP
ncbi:molybdopterin molybdotransferase MoeA [Cellulomonas sp. ICMP 17802]|uniref:molybdopterin molybdotransferase MoeA n=1 Tax=Cellulomonas sp. ICMP 17802 TaxID=3239199 RepID=UPI00351B87D3